MPVRGAEGVVEMPAGTLARAGVATATRSSSSRRRTSSIDRLWPRGKRQLRHFGVSPGIVGTCAVLLDLLLPPHCPGCGQEGTAPLRALPAPLRRRLDEPAGAPLGLPVAMPPGLLQLEWCATYSGPVRAALHALKYRGERRLAGPLASALADAGDGLGVGGDAGHLGAGPPVPTTRARLRPSRGAGAGDGSGAGAASRCPARAPPANDRPARLGQAQRAANTAARSRPASTRRGDCRGAWVLVVDDILTTGATLAGCAAALLESGAAAVSAIAVARDR